MEWVIFTEKLDFTENPRSLVLINMYVCINLKSVHTPSVSHSIFSFFSKFSTKKKTRPTQIKWRINIPCRNVCVEKEKKIGGHQSTEISTLMIEPTKYTIKMDYLDPDWFFIQIIKARVTFCPTHKAHSFQQMQITFNHFFSLSQGQLLAPYLYRMILSTHLSFLRIWLSIY